MQFLCLSPIHCAQVLVRAGLLSHRHKIAYGINDSYNDNIDSLSVFTIAKLAVILLAYKWKLRDN